MHNVKEQGVERDESASTPAVPTPPKKREEIQSFLPPELRVDALRSLFDPLRAAQEEIMGAEDTYFMLNSLATHPDHRGRGAASLLLDWGTKKADEEGLIAYLDATGVGKGLYEKAGFEVRKVLEWDRKPWGGEGMDCHYCMTRQPRRS
jgi:WD repeat-containing protein 48